MFGKNKKNQPQPRQVRYTSDRPGSTVFSYHASRSPDARNIGRNEPQKTPGQRVVRLDFRYIPTWVSVGAIIVSALYALTLAADAKVQLVSPNTSLTRQPGVYQQAANDILSSSFFNYGKLTINTESVADKLQQQFPEIQSIAVSIPLLGRRPEIAIQTAEPAFLLTSTKSGAYYVDDDGRAMVKASDVISGNAASRTIVRDESGILVEPNKQILPQNTVAFITTIIYQLNAQKISIDSIELPVVPYELRLKIAGAPYYVRMNTESGSREQVGTFIAVREKLLNDRIVPKEYIDVRVPERAFYR